MAILEAILTQVYYGNVLVNRFHYVMTGTPAAVTPSFALISAMGLLEATGSPVRFPAGTIGHALQTVQSVDNVFVSTYARNLYSVTDFYESPYPSTVRGVFAGEPASPALALGFKTSRVRTDIRRGYKRFGGVPEGIMGSGGTIATAELAAVQTVADRLSAVLSYDDEGNTLTFTPAVLGLEKYTTPSGSEAYRPYSTEAVQLTHTAQGFEYSYYTQIRTQVSRQYGRGI